MYTNGQDAVMQPAAADDNGNPPLSLFCAASRSAQSLSYVNRGTGVPLLAMRHARKKENEAAENSSPPEGTLYLLASLT